MSYPLISSLSLKDGSYEATSLREEDIFLIKKWRNSQVSVLRQNNLLTDEDQKHYFRTCIAPSFLDEQPQMILLSFLQQEKCIGYGGLVHIDWEKMKAEVSFLLDTELTLDPEKHQSAFLVFLGFLKKMAFEHLNFKKLTTETYTTRPHHIKILEYFGFQSTQERKNTKKINDAYVDSIFHEYSNPTGI